MLNSVAAEYAPFFTSFQKSDSLPFIIIATLGYSGAKPLPLSQPNNTQSKNEASSMNAILLLIFIFPSFLDLRNLNFNRRADIKLAFD